MAGLATPHPPFHPRSPLLSRPVSRAWRLAFLVADFRTCFLATQLGAAYPQPKFPLCAPRRYSRIRAPGRFVQTHMPETGAFASGVSARPFLYPLVSSQTGHLNVPTTFVFAQPCRRPSVPTATTAGQRLMRGLSRDTTRSLVNGFSCVHVRHRALSCSSLDSVSCALSHKPPGGVLCTPPRRRPAWYFVRIFYMRPRAASHSPQEVSRVLRHLERGDMRAR